MNLEGRKIKVNKSSDQLLELLKNPEEYKHLMPDSLTSFETRPDGFKFGLKGMPEVGLQIASINSTEVVLKSSSSSLDFSLKGQMNPSGESQTEVQLFFEGNFNPFIKMMVEKPLQSFINALTDKLEQL